MPGYYITSRTPQGRSETECVQGASSDEAVQKLRDRGHTDIVLHTDEVGALFPMPKQAAPFVTPRDYVGFRHRRGPLDRMLWLLFKLYGTYWVLYLSIIGFMILRRVMKEAWGQMDWIAVVLFAVPLLLALLSAFGGAPQRYNNLIEAASWGRSEEVLRLLPSIASRLPAHEAAFREAQARAGLGHLNEALAIVRPFADGDEIPQWLFFARLGGVYHIAGDKEQALASYEKAAEIAPDNPTVLLDAAFAVLRDRRDIVKGRAYLERAKTHVINDLAQPFLAKTEGALALETGKADEARQLFEKSLELSDPFLGNPLMRAANDLTHAMLALAHVALGDREAAEKHFRQAEPRLRALRYDDLLARCEKAGLHASD